MLDLHLGNALFRLPSHISYISRERLYELYGAPRCEQVRRRDQTDESLPPNVPRMATIPVWLGIASDKVLLSESQIMLTDFGEAFDPTKTKRLYSNTLPTHRPPEALFASAENQPLSFSADV